MLNRTNITECSSYVYLGREINMTNDLAPKLSRRKRAAWGAYKNIEVVTKKIRNIWLRVHFFDCAVLPASTYASKTWTLRKRDEHAVEFILRTLRESEEKVVLIAIGPLTNIAMALMQAGEAEKEKIDRIIIMGGAIYTEGNVTSAAEFNIYQDPEAARIVLQSGCTIYLNTLDISMKALFHQQDKERLRALGGVY